MRSLFLAALEVPVSEREAWLIAECGEDQELRRRVEELLDADESTGDGRLPLAGDVPRRVLQNELMTSLLGSRVASYQLRSVLGAGGMGTVFLAEQSHPKRTVALKMLSTGLSDEQARRRFEYESEVLGRLQHPAIAQVYEAGTWQDDVSGQDVPWFAMELVRNARPVTEFISKKRLDLTNTLNTFLEICDGVYHGHGLGVIHRDLKPANILVGSDEQPKIIDFGIAKTTQTGTKETQHTAAGQIFGTLQYMSPEQMAAAPGDLDIRTDVYALGVLLYELLTGRPPHDPTDTPVHVFAQKVRDTEPVRPSQVRDVRGRPGPSGLPQDLDWVVLKAMAKDREERYGSVSELAADVRRFLANEPVLAGPPGGIYRLRKLLRRQRVVVSAGVLILISILVGAGMTYREYRRATKAERQAKTNEHTAKHQATLAQQKTAEAQQLLQRANAEVAAQQDLVDFFQEIFDQARTVKKGKDVRVVDLLDSSSPHVDRDLGDQPRSAITIHATIGQTYLSLGHPKKARRHFESAVALADTHLEKHHSHRLWALRGLGMSLTLLEDETEYAERLLREALRLADQPADVDTDEPSIKKRRIDKMHSRMALTNLLLRCNRNEEAVREARLVASASRELYGDVEITANSLLVRALIRVPEHKPEGFKLADSNWRRAQSDLGPRHHVTLRQQALAAQCLAAQGQADESIRLMQSFLVAAPDALGNEHVETLVVRRLLALALARRNRHDEATEQWKLLVQHGAKTSVVSQHFADRHGLATSYAKAGRWSDAYAVYQAADKDLEDVVINPTLAAVIQYYYATHLIEHKRYADAEKRLLSALDKMKQTMPKGHFWFPRIHKKLVLLYQRWGKPEKAKEWKSKLR